MHETDTRVVSFLERGMLRHIALLKMLSLYGTRIRSVYLDDPRGCGSLLLLSAAVSPFDAKRYPGYDYVVMLSATTQQTVAELLRHVPHDAHLVFKLLDDADRRTVAEEFPLRRIVGIISFTATADSRHEASPDVCVTAQPDPCCYELFAAQGHSRPEVDDRFANSNARCFALCQDGQPACACFTYQNYANVYEISSVYTREEFRRRGLGRRVVQTALHELLIRGHIPRYQVHEQNAASIALAESVGLRPFSTLTHWVTD